MQYMRVVNITIASQLPVYRRWRFTLLGCVRDFLDETKYRRLHKPTEEKEVVHHFPENNRLCSVAASTMEMADRDVNADEEYR